MEKTFKTTKEQLSILSIRNLTIDMEDAELILKTTNYYNLINGYKEPFLLKNNISQSSANKLEANENDVYVDNSKISEIYNLYLFDKNISNLFLKYILNIENKIKSLIAYYFSENHKDTNEEYLKIENFNENISHSSKLQSDFKYINNRILKKHHVTLCNHI